LFTLDVDGIEKQILTSMSQFAAPITSSSPNGSFSSIIERHFLNEIPRPTYNADSTPHWSLIPVLSFGGLVSAQAGIVNKETLRLLFSSHDLRGHIAVQRDYHLFGDGVFCTRLSSALFDPDLERADRQAGVARRGGVMGLRLGGRDTWPPASSELRLALMGVLSESYSAKHPHDEMASQLLGRDSYTLPGDMSFAVRDLSTDEIDKCMVPDSLEALDFLRLSYKAPPELSFIITPIILMQYDRIFKLLLRVLRMVYTVDMLWRDALRSKEDLGDITYRFVRESHHFVTSISSYFLDTAIAGPWQAFDMRLDQIQAALDDQTDSMLEKLESPDQLRDLHSLVVKNITEGLFLRRKQEPVLKLLEDIFTIILDYAKISRAAGAASESFNTTELYKRFRKRTQVFITVCRGLTEKSQARSNKEDRALAQPRQIGEDSTVAQLLLKLDINNYYTKGR
jgi:hypothetical protein